MQHYFTEKNEKKVKMVERDCDEFELSDKSANFFENNFTLNLEQVPEFAELEFIKNFDTVFIIPINLEKIN